jgi:hypothetical protein
VKTPYQEFSEFHKEMVLNIYVFISRMVPTVKVLINLQGWNCYQGTSPELSLTSSSRYNPVICNFMLQYLHVLFVIPEQNENK